MVFIRPSLRFHDGRLVALCEVRLPHSGTKPGLVLYQVLPAVLVLTLAASGCASDKAFNIERSLFIERIKTIAVTPVSIPDGLENPESIRTEFESLLATRIQEAGYAVVPSTDYVTAVKHAAEEHGSVDSQGPVIREQTSKILNTKFAADAVLDADIRVVKAGWQDWIARWDGTSEKLKDYTEYVKDAFPLAFIGLLIIKSGTVPALSLVISIKDINTKQELYRKAGGIQVLAKLHGSEFVPVPRNELCSSKELNLEAIEIVVSPLKR